MSAFIVEDKTINRVVTWLSNQKNEKHYLMKRLSELGFNPDGKFEQKLAEAMFKLNQDAVVQRYGKLDKYAGKGHKIKFNIEIANKFQVLKSLKCWLYQCSEGDVPKRELFKFFDNDVSHSVMYEIIDALPEYNKTEWG